MGMGNREWGMGRNLFNNSPSSPSSPNYAVETSLPKFPSRLIVE
ncbi:hypothetical protein GXM_01045 [Nostoc sphaeroides CCNUC1]|uniref:Uncharacterized protein n=1 Tax=Nostoc sphaeroides CCNUC1 TaxID=2653204 RepID=A0A5P8VT64_9NOSO|nr:hypothetical protein GXM_01045 [Nostoc sphaeroides CCNUC1]